MIDNKDIRFETFCSPIEMAQLLTPYFLSNYRINVAEASICASVAILQFIENERRTRIYFWDEGHVAGLS